MEQVTCRLLPYALADGPHNMAADEALLESAARGVASFRLYGWSPATLSLGYFQAEQVRHSDPRLALLPFVRRPSGGATLVHDDELTYALTFPAGAPRQAGPQPAVSWLCRMHTIIAAALNDLGVPARTCAGKDQPFTGNLCFQHLTPGDLVIGTNKVVGSAQRRHRGALLQHGAILLAASPHAPILPGIGELSPTRLTPLEVAVALEKALARGTKWKLSLEDWTASERQRIRELVADKYTRDAWNCKR